MNPTFLQEIGAGAAALLLILLWGFFLLLGALVFGFWLWMLVHALRNNGLTDGERVAWVLVICLTHVLGALLYFFLGRPKAKAAPAVGGSPPAAPPPPPGRPGASSPSAPPPPAGSPPA